MYNALESIQAFEAGKTQRKDRERETAMKSIGNALAGGDITGAASQAFAVDPMYGMQIQQYGDGRNALALRKDIGGMLAGGDRKGAAAKAYGAGEFEMGANIDAQIAQMTQQQRQDALFLSGELGNAALTLQGITDPQQRAAQWQQMQGRFVNDFGMDPAALAQFDPMDDTALQRAIGEAQSFSDRLAGQRADQMFNYTMGQDEQAQSNWERAFAADEAARRATAASAGKFGVTPVYARDEKTGKRVILQTNNAGGVSQADLPEGLVLEDDYSRTFDRETAKEDAKKAAYESTAGRALSAFETKADLLVNQIDTAIDQTNQWNAGVLGQFIAAGDLDGTLDAIGAKAMLSELIAIKEQGGTMGALSDSEGAALRNAAVNVARSQSEKQLDANLRTYRLQVEKTKMTMKKAFEDEYVNGPNAVRGPAAPAAPAATAPNLFENLMNMYLPK
jgi:hypothetical protein